MQRGVPWLTRFGSGHQGSTDWQAWYPVDRTTAHV